MNQQTVTLAAIGFSTSELRLLRTVCSVSQASGRAVQYQLLDGPQQNDGTVFLFNMDDAQARTWWAAYRAAFPSNHFVIASCQTLIDTLPQLRRQLCARQILALLDELTTATSTTPHSPRFTPSLINRWQQLVGEWLNSDHPWVTA